MSKFRKTTAATVSVDLREFARFLEKEGIEGPDVNDVRGWLKVEFSTYGVGGSCDDVVGDLRRLADIVIDEPLPARRAAAKKVNDILDDWLSYDAFGTEGQCDPRGDHRD